MTLSWDDVGSRRYSTRVAFAHQSSSLCLLSQNGFIEE